MVLERTQKPRDVSRIRVREHLPKLCLVAIPGRFRRRNEGCGGLGLLCENLVDVKALAFETAKRRRQHGHEQEHILQMLSPEQGLAQRRCDFEPVQLHISSNMEDEGLFPRRRSRRHG